MPATAEQLIPSLIRWGVRHGLAALENLAMSQWDSLKETNGRQLISTSVNGESFTFSFAPGLDVSTLIFAADEAYKRTVAMNETGTLAAYLTQPLIKRSRATFGPAKTYL